MMNAFEREFQTEMNDQSDTLNAAETGGIQKVFEALSSAPRRKILAYLAHSSLTAGEIADRFDMSKPSISQHLNVLEGAGLVQKEKRGQYVHYSIVQESLANTLNSYVQEVCPVSRPLKKESATIAKTQDENRD